MIETNLRSQLARQFFIALQRRGADKLLSLLESYGDTLSDAEMLLLLQEYNLTEGAGLQAAHSAAGPAGSKHIQPVAAIARLPERQDSHFPKAGQMTATRTPAAPTGGAARCSQASGHSAARQRDLR
jgi:hypothetical protein